MSCCYYYSAFELLLTAWYVAICLLPARGRSLAAITDSYSAFELLLGTWPYASYHSVGRFSRSY